jgi:hypothetical protein
MNATKTSLLTCALLLSVAAFSQDWSGKLYKMYEIHPGYIIGLKNDTTHGFILLNNRVENQTSVAFYTNATDVKTRKMFKPTELKGYLVGDKFYRSINYSGGLSSKKQEFVLEVKPGRLAQMVYYLSNSGTESEEQMVWYREGENPIQHKDFILGFAKKMSKLISDYPELAKKVEDKEDGYRIGKVFQIVDEYNKWWANKG